MSCHFNYLPYHLSAKPCQMGFTMVEMMVVLTIFTIMTGVVMANLPLFRDRSALGLVAEEVALTIRQSQVYGGATKSFSSGFPSFGTYFDGGVSNSFIVFGDSKTTGALNKYDTSPACGAANTECLEQFNLTGVKIIGLYGCSPNCSLLTSPNNVFSVLFVRPEPEAKFFDSNGVSLATWSCAKVRLQSLRDTTVAKDVTIWNTGHIYVQDAAPSPATPGTC